jgi:hypothetical protein
MSRLVSAPLQIAAISGRRRARLLRPRTVRSPLRRHQPHQAPVEGIIERAAVTVLHLGRVERHHPADMVDVPRAGATACGDRFAERVPHGAGAHAGVDPPLEGRAGVDPRAGAATSPAPLPVEPLRIHAATGPRLSEEERLLQCGQRSPQPAARAHRYQREVRSTVNTRISTHPKTTQRQANAEQAAPRARDARRRSTRECPICGGDGFLVGDDEAEVLCDTRDGSGQVQRVDRAA